NYTFNVHSDIIDKNIGYRFDFTTNHHNLTFGANYVHHALRPNNVGASAENVELQFNNNVRLFSEEAAIYVNDKISLSDHFEVNAGLRFTGFRQLGPFTRYVENDNLQILDTVVYTKNETVTKYFNAEPRLAA